MGLYARQHDCPTCTCTRPLPNDVSVFGERKLEQSEFTSLLKTVRSSNGLTLQSMGKSLGYSATYLSDLERGKRSPSVQFINRICEWSGRGTFGRAIWHRAGAIANGWEIGKGFEISEAEALKQEGE